MVYESDFYTTRRPYSRPTVTSYSVTVQSPYYKNIPYIGHKRLVIVQPSATGWRVKQSALLGEVDRIYHKVRPSLAHQPQEDYLNSRAITCFDDETRNIRARTAEILKRIHTPVPRAQRPLPLPGEAIDQFLKLRHDLTTMALKLIMYPTSLDTPGAYYSHTELPITERITSNNYIDRLLSSIGNHPVYVTLTPHEYEPRTYSRLGKGHLACVTYAGGRPILRRKNLASVDNYIKDDINVLSHYNRFRQAAEKASIPPMVTEYGSIPHPPPSVSPSTGSWKSNAPRRTQSDRVLVKPTSCESENAQEKKKKRREAAEEAAAREVEEEKRRCQELKRQEELAAQAAAEREAELERKARQEEEERILREEAERLEALKKAQEEEERRAKEEEEARLAKEKEERLAEEKRKAKEEEERRAEEERKAREEEERRLKEEEEERRRQEEERLAREEEERRKEEERIAREEEERMAREEEERIAREEEERIAKEEEERRAKEEQEAKEAEAEEHEEAGEKEENPEAENLSKNEEHRTDEEEAEPVVEEPTTPVPPDEEEPEKEEEDEEEEEE